MIKPIRTLTTALLLLGALVCARVPRTPSIAKTSAPAGIESLYQSLVDLSLPWTVMCLAAHPDDEDGETLTYLRKKFGIRTYTLLSTRGEGGQNAVGPELYEELGVIRAHESAAAAVIQGTDVQCLNLRDFGFSKSGDEAMKIWGHDEALRRMVLKIRQLRPDVIFTNHDTSTGHGQHQAMGRLVLEAFSAAADPTKFPEQLSPKQLSKDVSVWQVKRLFVRAPRQSQTADVSYNTNQTDPVLGRSYAEMALEALHQHASQEPWPQRIAPGPRMIHYNLAKHEGPALIGDPLPFFGGLEDLAVHPFLLSPSETTPLIFQSKQLLARLLEKRAQLADAVGSKAGDAGTQQHLLKLQRDYDGAIRETAGLQIEAIPDDRVAVRDQLVKVRLIIHNRGALPFEIDPAPHFQYRDTRFPVAPSQAMNASRLAPQAFCETAFELRIPPDAEQTLPETSVLYAPSFLQPFGEFHFRWKADGASVPSDYAVPLNVDVAPTAEVNVKPDRHLIPAARFAPLGVTVRIRNRAKKPLSGLVELAGKGRLKYFVLLSFNSLGEDEEQVLRGEFPARVVRSLDAISVRVVDRAQKSLAEREVALHQATINTRPLLRVGYIRSFDDTLRDALAELGVRAEPLTVEDIQTRELKSFTTIIVDIRGYFAHPELVKVNSRLLAFAKNGGTLIVFYHKTNEWNAEAGYPELAPYPIHAANLRITDENAPVKLLLPKHPLLSSPNRITEKDFDGWRQERGLYFPDKWDAHYDALLSSFDPGEQPLDGGYLVASYGKGAYIHTSYVWYRELRELNAGAFRIFANMISYRASVRKR